MSNVSGQAVEQLKQELEHENREITMKEREVVSKRVLLEREREKVKEMERDFNSVEQHLTQLKMTRQTKMHEIEEMRKELEKLVGEKK